METRLALLTATPAGLAPLTAPADSPAATEAAEPDPADSSGGGYNSRVSARFAPIFLVILLGGWAIRKKKVH